MSELDEVDHGSVDSDEISSSDDECMESEESSQRDEDMDFLTLFIYPRLEPDFNFICNINHHPEIAPMVKTFKEYMETEEKYFDYFCDNKELYFFCKHQQGETPTNLMPKDEELYATVSKAFEIKYERLMLASKMIRRYIELEKSRKIAVISLCDKTLKEMDRFIEVSVLVPKLKQQLTAERQSVLSLYNKLATDQRLIQLLYMEDWFVHDDTERQHFEEMCYGDDIKKKSILKVDNVVDNFVVTKNDATSLFSTPPTSPNKTRIPVVTRSVEASLPTLENDRKNGVDFH